MFLTHETFGVYRMGVEEFGFQRALASGFNRRARELGKYFRVELLKGDTTKSKIERISGFQPYCVAGKVFMRVSEGIDLTMDRDLLFHSLVEGQDTLLDELVRFPGGTTVDCLDALAYAPQLVFAAPGPPRPQPDPMSYESLYPSLTRRSSQGGESLTEIR